MGEYISREAALETVREGLGLECGVVEDLDVEDNEVYLNVERKEPPRRRCTPCGAWGVGAWRLLRFWRCVFDLRF